MPVPRLGVYANATHVLMGDGNVWKVAVDIPADALKGLVTRNGGELGLERFIKPVPRRGPALQLEFQRRASRPLSDEDRLQGKWRVTSMDVGGKSVQVGWGLADVTFAGVACFRNQRRQQRRRHLHVRHDKGPQRDRHGPVGWQGTETRHLQPGREAADSMPADAGVPRPTKFKSGNTARPSSSNATTTTTWSNSLTART